MGVEKPKVDSEKLLANENLYKKGRVLFDSAIERLAKNQGLQKARVDMYLAKSNGMALPPDDSLTKFVSRGSNYELKVKRSDSNERISLTRRYSNGFDEVNIFLFNGNPGNRAAYIGLTQFGPIPEERASMQNDEKTFELVSTFLYLL